jgi:predicted nuclease of predicted toxin-antitoxin system
MDKPRSKTELHSAPQSGDRTPPRILFDHCVSRKLARYLPAHIIEFAGRIGWADLQDGPLLDAMVGRFDILITTDQNLQHQQTLRGRPVSVIVLQAQSGHVRYLATLVPEIERAIDHIQPGDLVIVSTQ